MTMGTTASSSEGLRTTVARDTKAKRSGMRDVCGVTRVYF